MSSDCIEAHTCAVRFGSRLFSANGWAGLFTLTFLVPRNAFRVWLRPNPHTPLQIKTRQQVRCNPVRVAGLVCSSLGFWVQTYLGVAVFTDSACRLAGALRGLTGQAV